MSSDMTQIWILQHVDFQNYKNTNFQ